MKWTAVFIVILILSIAGVIYSRQHSIDSGQLKPTPTITNSVTTTPLVPTKGKKAADCSKDDLEAKVTFGGAAGNIYGVFTVQNRGESACVFVNSYVSALFNKEEFPTVKENKVSRSEQTSFTLVRNAKLYASIHAPNGPQCSGGIKQVMVPYGVVIPSSGILHATIDGKDTFPIQACNGSESTVIDLSNFSDQAIPQ